MPKAYMKRSLKIGILSIIKKILKKIQPINKLKVYLPFNKNSIKL